MLGFSTDLSAERKKSMRSFLIGYDLNKPGQDYPGLFEAIKNLGSTWWHCLDSTWIVNSAKSTVEIRNVLASRIDGNDKLLVVELSGPAAWTGFEGNCQDWLHRNLIPVAAVRATTW